MGVILAFGILAVGLFAASFITKRRFGLLGLALGSGYILSSIWSNSASLVVGLAGLPYNAVTAAMILVFITLLPAVILLFHGYSYKSLVLRIIGAGLFTVLALAFLAEPLGRILNLQGSNLQIYDWILKNKDVIIGIGLPMAVVDMFLTKPAALSEKKSKH
ncbi:hypothetical protein HGB24_02970 [Candidatus Saccharibacteria bacterium]|nr:hypothetical protein [Candidatus Saccharibacteria bacterium]